MHCKVCGDRVVAIDITLDNRIVLSCRDAVQAKHVSQKELKKIGYMPNVNSTKYSNKQIKKNENST